MLMCHEIDSLPLLADIINVFTEIDSDKYPDL